MEIDKEKELKKLYSYFAVKDKQINAMVNSKLYEKVKEKIKTDKDINSVSDLITLCFVKYIENTPES